MCGLSLRVLRSCTASQANCKPTHTHSQPGCFFVAHIHVTLPRTHTHTGNPYHQPGAVPSYSSYGSAAPYHGPAQSLAAHSSWGLHPHHPAASAVSVHQPAAVMSMSPVPQQQQPLAAVSLQQHPQAVYPAASAIGPVSHHQHAAMASMASMPPQQQQAAMAMNMQQAQVCARVVHAEISLKKATWSSHTTSGAGAH